MYSTMKKCPHCSRISLEIVYTNAIRNFTCGYCGYFQILAENNKELNLEEDQGRYIYWESGEPYGSAIIRYKSGNEAKVVISKRSCESFIDNIIYNRSEITNVFLNYFTCNEFHKIDLLEYL